MRHSVFQTGLAILLLLAAPSGGQVELGAGERKQTLLAELESRFREQQYRVQLASFAEIVRGLLAGRPGATSCHR